MKRELEVVADEQQQQQQPLPDELLLLVAHADDWCNTNVLAFLSHRTLRLFTRRDVLFEIVETCLARNMLLPWLLMALPCAWLSEPMPVPMVLEMGMTFGAFVTGGAVAQLLYNRKWDCDNDVWVASSWERAQIRETYRGDNAVDIVVRPPGLTVQSCISRFDVSVTQQGYISGATPTTYCTPLALYSWKERVLVALPSRQLIEYHGYDTRYTSKNLTRVKMKVNVWHYIRSHEANYLHPQDVADGMSHAGPYHECAFCDGLEGGGHSQFQKWRKRMRRYAKRFPDFKLVYCQAPDDVETLIELGDVS